MKHLEGMINSCNKRNVDTQKWVELVNRYLNMEKLTRKAVIELTDHTDVSERKKVNGRWE